MSCQAMGLGGGAIVLGYVVAIGLYSCGPNVIVGAVGLVTTGILATKDKVNKVFLEKQLAAEEAVDDHEKLHERVTFLEDQQKYHLNLCRLFAWSMIPIVGPFIAISKST